MKAPLAARTRQTRPEGELEGASVVSSAAQTVEAYLSELPAPRRAVVAQMRALVNAHLPGGYEEGMAYGMIGWSVPLARYPGT